MTVLIQGAGIAGLALAREFTKAGIDWLLVERASEIRPIGTGITLASNALTALSSTLISTGCSAVACRWPASTYTPTTVRC